jgi:hypothetical protein
MNNCTARLLQSLPHVVEPPAPPVRPTAKTQTFSGTAMIATSSTPYRSYAYRNKLTDINHGVLLCKTLLRKYSSRNPYYLKQVKTDINNYKQKLNKETR